MSSGWCARSATKMLYFHLWNVTFVLYHIWCTIRTRKPPGDIHECIFVIYAFHWHGQGHVHDKSIQTRCRIHVPRQTTRFDLKWESWGNKFGMDCLLLGANERDDKPDAVRPDFCCCSMCSLLCSSHSAANTHKHARVQSISHVTLLKRS